MLFDTSAYSALVLGKQQIVDVLRGAEEIVVPLPVIAELCYGFALGSRTDENNEKLQRFLAQPRVRIVAPGLETTKHYAQLAVLCRQSGRALAHNDLWIAALAREHALLLVTYDKDFGAFDKLLGNKLRILTD